jgi:hypothetical protein
MKAVDKFSTAAAQILHACDVVDPPSDHPLGADQVRTIRILVHMIDDQQAGAHSRQMLHEIGREPTPENSPKSSQCRSRESAQGAEDCEGAISLETPIGDEEDSHLGDFIEDRTRCCRWTRRSRPICARPRPACSSLTKGAQSCACGSGLA